MTLTLKVLAIMHFPSVFIFVLLHLVNNTGGIASRHANDFYGAISANRTGNTDSLPQELYESKHRFESKSVMMDSVSSENKQRDKPISTVKDLLATVKDIPPLPLINTRKNMEMLNWKAMPHRYIPQISQIIQQRMANPDHDKFSSRNISKAIGGSYVIDKGTPNEKAKRRQKEIFATEIVMLVILLSFMLLFAYSAYYIKKWMDRTRNKRSYIDQLHDDLAGAPGAAGARPQGAPSSSGSGAQPRVTFSAADGGARAPGASRQSVRVASSQRSGGILVSKASAAPPAP